MIDFRNFLFEGKVAMFSIRILEEEENRRNGNTAEWQIDPKAGYW
jgi:hypothetical protein